MHTIPKQIGICSYHGSIVIFSAYSSSHLFALRPGRRVVRTRAHRGSPAINEGPARHQHKLIEIGIARLQMFSLLYFNSLPASNAAVELVAACGDPPPLHRPRTLAPQHCNFFSSEDFVDRVADITSSDRSFVLCGSVEATGDTLRLLLADDVGLAGRVTLIDSRWIPAEVSGVQ